MKNEHEEGFTYEQLLDCLYDIDLKEPQYIFDTPEDPKNNFGIDDIIGMISILINIIF